MWDSVWKLFLYNLRQRQPKHWIAFLVTFRRNCYRLYIVAQTSVSYRPPSLHQFHDAAFSPSSEQSLKTKNRDVKWKETCFLCCFMQPFATGSHWNKQHKGTQGSHWRPPETWAHVLSLTSAVLSWRDQRWRANWSDKLLSSLDWFLWQSSRYASQKTAGMPQPTLFEVVGGVAGRGEAEKLKATVHLRGGERNKPQTYHKS